MLTIRPAVVEDIPLILDLIRALAEYEHAPELALATAEDLRRDGWGEEPKFHCLIAEWREGDGVVRPVAFALYFYNYSTWRGRHGIYLEDLFVRPEYRRRGVATALLVRLAQVAVEQRCGRFEWQVLDWNQPAISFYQTLGAKMMTTWRTMRVEGDDIARLAAAKGVGA